MGGAGGAFRRCQPSRLWRGRRPLIGSPRGPPVRAPHDAAERAARIRVVTDATSMATRTADPIQSNVCKRFSSIVAALRRSLTLELRRDLRCELLEVLQLVEDGVQHEEAGARGNDLEEPVDALPGVAPHRHLGGQLGLAVEGAEPLGEPPPCPRAVAVDRDVDALAERERRGVAPGLLEDAAQEFALADERRRRGGARADEAVAELHGAAERIGLVPAEPERRVRLLQGLRLQGCVVELEELALEGDGLLGPQTLHEPEPFGETLRASRRAQTERRVDPRVAAEPDPDGQAPPAQVVEGREALREVNRAPQRGEQDRGAEPQPLRARRRVREQRDRLEALDRAQDLLDDPRALKAERFGAQQELADLADVERARQQRLGNRDTELDATLHAANPTILGRWYSVGRARRRTPETSRPGDRHDATPGDDRQGGGPPG